MNKEYKIVEGKYESEDDVIIQVDTTETTTNVLSSNFNVGSVKKQIANIDTQIASLIEEKNRLESLLGSTVSIMKKAVLSPKTNE